ncbi:hypothetical protein [Subtercola boreus]|uniref:hypothetical protein n=1 Tax=Subtercola boreus TaxID=120213 RepID=UPI001559B786|nr:hypothetical protein [Subtercola boreus]
MLALQAVEHAQIDSARCPLRAFISSLQEDERRVDELESGLSSLMLRLLNLELKP